MQEFLAIFENKSSVSESQTFLELEPHKQAIHKPYNDLTSLTEYQIWMQSFVITRV